MTSGSTRKSATGKIRSLELKERLDRKSKITSSSPSLKSHRSVRLSSSSGLCCDLMTRGKERSSHCMPRHRKLLIKNNSNYCLMQCVPRISSPTVVLLKWISPLVLRIHIKRLSQANEMHKNARQFRF